MSRDRTNKLKVCPRATYPICEYEIEPEGCVRSPDGRVKGKSLALVCPAPATIRVRGRWYCFPHLNTYSREIRNGVTPAEIAAVDDAEDLRCTIVAGCPAVAVAQVEHPHTKFLTYACERHKGDGKVGKYDGKKGKRERA